MPGIHVRTFGNNDWNEREKDPTLTVPGAYWLCHKKNIFKFTLKYHKTLRNTKQDFEHGRELMKVIRRIIKSQPRQGQQFGTRHLIVTYNHSAWTRQDKMFAMLKFQERVDVAVYPRAFVLTVRILSGNTISNSTTEYVDGWIVYKNKPEWEKFEEKKNDPSDDEKNSRLPAVNGEEFPSENAARLDLLNSSPNELMIESVRSIDRQKTPNSASFLGDLDNLPLLERYLLEQRDQPEDSFENNQSPLNDMQETIDMPYQYLIEREIEKTKNSAKQKAQQSSPSGKTKDTTRNKAQSAIKIIDNPTARSENITDLVMEGLMFTIRQDQDSITVVEQKTKLEPDEVLENSEKVETLGGAECLVNSSLLKLENLVTKIEKSSLFPKKTELPISEKNSFANENFPPNRYNIGNCIDTFSDINQKNESEGQILPQTPAAKKGQSLMTSNYSFFNMDLNDIHENSKKKCDDDLNRMDMTDSFHLDDDENMQDNDDVDMQSNISIHPQNQSLLVDNQNANENFVPSELSLINRIPKIVSSEIVKIDLSNLCSVKSTKSSESSKDNEISNLKNSDDISDGAKLEYENKIESSDKTDENSNSETSRKNEQLLSSKRKRLTSNIEPEGAEVQIKMWKFLQDMTRGVRVVVKRLDPSHLLRRRKLSNNIDD